MKLCPFCEGEINDTARKCRHCGEWIEGRDPVESGIQAVVETGGPARPPESPSMPPPPPAVAPDVAPRKEASDRTSALAVTCLVLGVLSVFTMPAGVLLALLAVVFGHVSRRKIKKSGGSLRGGRLALIGLIIGYLAIVGWILQPSSTDESGKDVLPAPEVPERTDADVIAGTELEDAISATLEAHQGAE